MFIGFKTLSHGSEHCKLLTGNIFDTDAMTFTDDPSIIKYFTNGQCNALAWELHKLTYWNLGIFGDYYISDDGDYDLAHAVVVDPYGNIVDITGRNDFDTIAKKWHFLPHFKEFTDPGDYRKHMQVWENDVPYNRDYKARKWARKIVNMLS